MSGLFGKVVTNGNIQKVATYSDPNFMWLALNAADLSRNGSEIKIWIGAGTDPVDGDLVEPKIMIPADGTAKVTNYLLSEGESLWVMGAQGAIAVRAQFVQENAG